MGEITTVTRNPRVLILLATYNGAKFLDEQLASLLAQDIDHLDISVSDDGSTDDTMAILFDWQRRWTKGMFSVTQRPHGGFAENFRTLSQQPAVGADYIAFCDQDDIWDCDKLAVAVAALAGHAGQPAVYFSCTRLINAEGGFIGHSPRFSHQPNFRNAIVQSIGGGNTMVLNAMGFALFAESARRTPFVAHDWWAYIIVSGAGGYVHYDRLPHIDYRQHDANAVGSNVGLRARIHRLELQGRGTFGHWSDINIAALRRCTDLLTVEAAITLAQFAAMRRRGALGGLSELRRSGIHRQTLPGNIALAIAVTLGMS